MVKVILETDFIVEHNSELQADFLKRHFDIGKLQDDLAKLKAAGLTPEKIIVKMPISMIFFIPVEWR